MTTVVTRLYEDEATANAVGMALMENRFRQDMITVITSGGDLAAEMADAMVSSEARDAYAHGISNGNALLVVDAPFGAAQTAWDIVDATESIDVGPIKQSNYVATDLSADYRKNVLTDHPRFMSSAMYPSLLRGRTIIARMFGEPLLNKRLKIDTALYRGTKFWADFPIPHLRTKPRNMDNSIYRGTKFWANFPLPHLVREEQDKTLY